MSHWLPRIIRLRCGQLVSTISFSALIVCSAHAQTAAQTPPSRFPPRVPPAKPSIILILADSIGYGDLGCYGQTQIQTPNLDELAANGTRFTSFYSGGAQVVPSSASLLLGKHTGHLDIRGDHSVPLRLDDVTLPELLIPARYATGAFGHWGLGEVGSSGEPNRKGFEEFFGYFDETLADNYFPELLYRCDPSRGVTLRELSENMGGQRGKYANDYFSEAAWNMVRLLGPERAFPNRAFFMYLPYTIARANRQLGASSGNGMEITTTAAPYDNQPWPQPERNKAAMISRLDRYVGSLVAKLKDLKNENDTVIIFTSGSGPHSEGGVHAEFLQSAGKLRGGKGDVYEGGIRVPFIAWWPGHIKAGATSDLPCAAWDVMPTITEIAGISSPTNIDGISLMPTLTGQSQTNRHEFLYWESHEKGFSQAARMGDWKGVRSGVDGVLELYNLKTDPSEHNNLAAHNPKIVAQIEAYLKTARTEDKNWPAKNAAGEVVGAH